MSIRITVVLIIIALAAIAWRAPQSHPAPGQDQLLISASLPSDCQTFDVPQVTPKVKGIIEPRGHQLTPDNRSLT